MSKPTFSFFCVHTGYFRNDRTLELRDRIGERAFCVMPMLWSWASENQLDGDVSRITVKRYKTIFEGCQLKLTLAQTRRIVDAIHEVGFIQKGFLHSWDKFNRHCVEHEKRRIVKQAAAIQRWTRRVEGGDDDEDRKPRESTKHKGNGADSPSKKLWLIESALKTAKGRAKKELLIQREELLSEHTGVDLSEPIPTVRAPQQRNPRAPLPKTKMRNALAQLKEAVNDGNPVPE